jgi:hypothetical protein
MLVLDKFGFKNVCYCFPGLESPLGISKYWYSKYIAEQFDKKFFRGLKKAQLVLASGDEKSIGEMVQRSRGIITKDEVKMYPTRIKTELYKPRSKSDCIKKLGMPEDKKIICTTEDLHAQRLEIMSTALSYSLKLYLIRFLYIMVQGRITRGS